MQMLYCKDILQDLGLWDRKWNCFTSSYPSQLISPFFSHSSPFLPNFSVFFVSLCSSDLALCNNLSFPLVSIYCQFSTSFHGYTRCSQYTSLLYLFSVLCCFLNISGSFCAVCPISLLFSVWFFLFLLWHPGDPSSFFPLYFSSHHHFIVDLPH